MELEQLKMTIAKKLRIIRKERDLSQEDVARQLGMTTGAYGSFERAQNLIALNYLIDLSRIFQVPITQLLPAYIVTNSERANPMLDPNLQFIIEHWPNLPPAVCEALAHVVAAAVQIRAEKRGE